MINNKKIAVFFVVLILIVLGLLLAVFRTNVTYLGRATDQKDSSLVHSYFFASPLIVQSGGQEKIRVSAFLLNEQGRGVEGQQIQVASTPSLNISSVQPLTDRYGQAIFEASSPQPGRFAVSASFQGQPFPQTVTLTFR